MNFVDSLRKTPNHSGVKCFAGFDPDLHQAGMAQVLVYIDKYQRRTLSSIETYTFQVPKNIKDTHAAEEMIRAMDRRADAFSGDLAVVEMQQVYPPRGPVDAKCMKELVAKANDLLLIGQVSGAAAALFEKNRCATSIWRPAKWKGQKAKGPMFSRATCHIRESIDALLRHNLKILDVDALVPGTMSQEAWREAYYKAIGPHVADALCMALSAAGYKV